MGGNRKQWKRTAALFLGSQCITLFGSTLVQMAVVWYVTLATSSGVWVGAFSVCSYLPPVPDFISGRSVGRPLQPEDPDRRGRCNDGRSYSSYDSGSAVSGDRHRRC